MVDFRIRLQSPAFYPVWGLVKQGFAHAYKAFYAWVFLPEVSALQRTINDLKGIPTEGRTLKRILLLPNTITLYRYRVSGIWRHDLSHGGNRPAGEFETQASIACVVWGNMDHFRIILRGWETYLEKTPEADAPSVTDMLGVSGLRRTHLVSLTKSLVSACESAALPSGRALGAHEPRVEAVLGCYREDPQIGLGWQ